MWTSWGGGRYSVYHIAPLNSMRCKAFFFHRYFFFINSLHYYLTGKKYGHLKLVMLSSFRWQVKRSIKAILNASPNPGEMFTDVFKWHIYSFKTLSKVQWTKEYPYLSSICLWLRHNVWCSFWAVWFIQTSERKT